MEINEGIVFLHTFQPVAYNPTAVTNVLLEPYFFNAPLAIAIPVGKIAPYFIPFLKQFHGQNQLALGPYANFDFLCCLDPLLFEQ